MKLDRRLKVMRKRRKKSLRNKIWEFASLFNMDIAVILRDKTSLKNEVIKSTRDETWPPMMENAETTIVQDENSEEKSKKLQLMKDLDTVHRRFRQMKMPVSPAQWRMRK
ncbi:hypothetical protein B0T10DRAFT_564382 [Thelonectria olida]|uniref:MADS-box domain-containing protein n=1 Tax=Thelonectria olida TaxID=1576542 RepID=A0A9P9AMH1_9HYPO|nr:hypothetical protein B0T10DRAFT_564382 [Thelonectria olida]